MYVEERKRKEFLEEKKEKWKENEEMEQNETEMWRYINKKRGRREWVENDISKERWKSHFRNLLEETSLEKKKEEEVLEERKESTQKKISEIFDVEIIFDGKEEEKRQDQLGGNNKRRK